MKIISYILKIKIPFSLALLLIVATAVNTEELFLKSVKENNRAGDALAAIDWSSNRASLGPWINSVKEQVALTGASIPLIPGAQRLTFDGGLTVRYRVAAPTDFVADFYRQVLASQGWRANGSASANGSDRLTIALAESPLSGKTDVTYAYAPLNAAVLGVKVAVDEPSAPTQPSQPMPPAPEQYQQQPMQPQQPTSDGQYQPQPMQPQPNQPMPDGQYQQQPMYQPNTNQMEFNRQPMQPNDQGGKQTCRVNGVEMPGSCEQYNNQNQGPNGPGDQTNQGERMGQQGPSEQDQKRMEENQKKMDERRFKDMKRGLSQFSNGAKMMKKSLAKVKVANAKCGVGMPEELENALAQTDSLVAKINAAKTADELEEIIGDVQDVGSVMQEWGPRMGDLSRLCQMLKQADRDAKQFDRDIKRIEAQVKANKKVDLSELLAEYKTAVNEQKTVLAEAKELAKTDPDSALSKIEDDFYGNMDNLGNLRMQIDAIVNITKGLSNINREINTFAAQIKSLARKKVDTASMQELLNNLKTLVAEIKDLIKNKADAEELVSKIEEAFDTRQELQDALQEYDLIKTIPKIGTGSNFNVKMNLPEAFMKDENDENDAPTQAQPVKPAPTSSSGAVTPKP